MLSPVFWASFMVLGHCLGGSKGYGSCLGGSGDEGYNVSKEGALTGE